MKKSMPARGIPVAVSARHVHLTKETFASLFGADAEPVSALMRRLETLAK